MSESPAIPRAEAGLVTFFVGGVEYGVPVERVHEIVRVDTITRVPAAPHHLRGLTTHRGRMIPVVDLATALRGDPHMVPLGAHARMVAVEVGARVVGLLVDRTSAVVQGRPVQVLDVDRLLEAR
jgi:purine-binding chemotaxis protein CheW